jgi:hypothetical protein
VDVVLQQAVATDPGTAGKDVNSLQFLAFCRFREQEKIAWVG